MHPEQGCQNPADGEAASKLSIAEPLGTERLQSEGLRLIWAHHRIKVGLAQRLRRETPMDLKWIAEELADGSWKYLSSPLSREEAASGQGEFNL